MSTQNISLTPIGKVNSPYKQKFVIPRQANLKVGDTIITGGMSSIFPEGIPIGRVVNIINEATIKRIINIKLFNDMSNLKNIYVIKDFDKQQIINLEKNNNE